MWCCSPEVEAIVARIIEKFKGVFKSMIVNLSGEGVGLQKLDAGVRKIRTACGHIPD